VGGNPGNGVTTTLYAAIHQIHKDRKLNQGIASLETVVRQELPYVHQTELGGGNAAAIFEGIAAQNHEAILVRHIDGKALAELAVGVAGERAMVVGATPGHNAAELLVSAWELVGTELLVQSQPSALAQRLIIRLCPDCCTPASVLPNQQIAGWDFSGEFHAATGCDTCQFTGRVGKVGLHQWIGFSEGLANTLRETRNAGELRERLQSLIPSFAELALEKAKAGETTLEQVIELIHEEQSNG
jgi:general secretion pathway protein E